MKSFLAAIGVVVLITGAWYFTSHTAEAPEVGTGEPKAESQEKPAPVPMVVYDNATSDLIIVDFPTPGAIVGHAFTVTGVARGQWYFEADFPIEVRSAQGDTLLMLPATAQGEWMTTEFVPFTAPLTIAATYSGPATLILHNHNASGLPEHERSLTIPIVIE